LICQISGGNLLKIIREDYGMATKEEKLAALSKLMVDGILSADEFSRVVAALDGAVESKTEREKSPAEIKYENYIQNTVARLYKSPTSVKCPPFEASMVKEGTIKLNGKEQHCKYIETYVDAANSYGTMLREPIIIGIDDDFNLLWWAKHVKISTLLGNTKGWVKMNS
jgi:hypothetical protein